MKNVFAKSFKLIALLLSMLMLIGAITSSTLNVEASTPGLFWFDAPWEGRGTASVTITFGTDLATFERLEFEDKKVDASNYTVSQSSSQTVITLSEGYLKTLDPNDLTELGEEPYPFYTFWAVFTHSGEDSDWAVLILHVTSPSTPMIPRQPIFRLYNPNNGNHFFTRSVGERNDCIARGWRFEGIAWYAPTSESDGIPIFRLYNPNNGNHFFTRSVGERNGCIARGWVYEGIAFLALRDPSEGVAIHRLYNPNNGMHFFTRSVGERNNCIARGLLYEGVGFYELLP